MRTTTITSELGAPADVVWAGVQTPHAFVHIANGMVRFPAASRLEGPWEVGQTIVGWTFLLNVIPFSKHHLTVASIDHETRTVVSDEHGGLLRSWYHSLHVEPLADGRCRYTDTIDIDAGPLTPIVAGYALVFYRYRQWRWKRLARLLAAANAAATRTSRSGRSCREDGAESPSTEVTSRPDRTKTPISRPLA